MNNADLRYKIGQMLIVGFDGMNVAYDSLIVKQIKDYALGGVILFDYNFNTQTFSKNIETPEQVLALNENLQKFNSIFNQQQQRQNQPLFISVDYEGGRVDRLKNAYGFPKTLSAASVAKDLNINVAQVAATMAQTLKASGFNVNFAPVVDINVNPENPILGSLGRCFGNSPAIVTKFASIYAEEFIKAGIAPVFKHFPGHGSSSQDSHLGFVDVTDSWQPYELHPYRDIECLKNPLSMIMTAHIINRNLDATGVPATLSQKILKNILREELNFQGVIISDDMQMKAITDQYSLEDALTLAINAGVDLFIFGNQLVTSPYDPAEIIEIIYSQVARGKISSQTIDESYVRIKKVKANYKRIWG